MAFALTGLTLTFATVTVQDSWVNPQFKLNVHTFP
jgi:hypothetical protein